MFEHATTFGAVYEYGLVQEIKDLGDTKEVVCEEETYVSKAV